MKNKQRIETDMGPVDLTVPVGRWYTDHLKKQAGLQRRDTRTPATLQQQYDEAMRRKREKANG